MELVNLFHGHLGTNLQHSGTHPTVTVQERSGSPGAVCVAWRRVWHWDAQIDALVLAPRIFVVPLYSAAVLCLLLRERKLIELHLFEESQS